MSALPFSSARGCVLYVSNVPDDLAVDGAGHAVLELQVHLWHGVLCEDGGIRDITYTSSLSVPSSLTGCCRERGAPRGDHRVAGLQDCRSPREHRVHQPPSVAFEWSVRTDSSGFDHVADGESLDCLVLGRASRAVAAANWLDVATALLVATAAELSAFLPDQRDREVRYTWMLSS